MSQKEILANFVLAVVTASGATSIKEGTAEPGATLASVLQEAGYSTEGMEVSVDGKPVTDLNEPLISGTYRVEVSRKALPKKRVTLTERVRGS